MNTQLSLACLLVAIIVHITYIYLRRRNSFLRKLQGPESTSLWLGEITGNEGDIRYQHEVGDRELEWMRKYGSAWRRSGPLGVDHLSLADPKALQYVLHTCGYHFPKGRETTQAIKMTIGQGIIWAHGTAHQRQRKVMSPAFSAPQVKTFLPLFLNAALKLTQKWKEEVISLDPTGQPVINVITWLSRTTLDVIGEAGFDFHFGSLDNESTPLGKQYENLFIDSSLYPSQFDLVFRALWRYIPEPLLHYVRYLPFREYRRLRSFLNYSLWFSRDLVRESIEKTDGKDIISILLRANTSENPINSMTDDEVVGQIANLLLAGHDTTANTLSWFLWEIAKHPECQRRIREEIAAFRARKGEEHLSVSDLDDMKYTEAVLKESMRLNPIVWILRREAGRDEVIPLAFPVTTKSGDKVSSVPIKQGTPIDIHIDAYNRLPEIWGPDADEWNPDRFLDADKKDTDKKPFPVAAGGLRSCIGWRFA
ncbi:cytochrome P450 [Russula earlei]|uniref:Cytochrome P450 n=1 Tax=Russula earlei TaxID=71964 RepID=A0ACC0TWY9_9AGAM|nr:cytochrome P450 [Russula earlei]